MVQTTSPVVILSLITPPLLSVKVSHPSLLQGENISVVRPEIEEVNLESVGHVVLLYKEREVSRRMQENFYLVQQRLV